MSKVLFPEGIFGTRLGLPPLKGPMKFGNFPELTQFIFVLKNFETLWSYQKEKTSLKKTRRDYTEKIPLHR